MPVIPFSFLLTTKPFPFCYLRIIFPPLKLDMPVIKVSALHKQFRDVYAVNDLSFTVEEADIYGFLGQNGAGKSTTIRMLLSLITPTSGEIEFFGMNLRTHRNEILRNVGAIIERPDLYKYLSAYENLQVFARMSGVKIARKQLMEQLEMVGLANRAHSKAGTYSQGMKQRLGIAIALAHNPPVIILDEPTNGLDPQGIADIRNLILHLSRHLKKTVFVSSHLLNEIEQIASRILIIDKGKKKVEGTASELLNPANTLLEVKVPNASAAAEQLRNTAWHSYIKEVNNHTLVFQLHQNNIALLNKELVQLGIAVQSLQPQTSLEAYFLSLTGSNQHVASFTN
jgi:ABC-type multidrug transport system ATPase subunit